jgi:hypothetical protein
MGRCPKSWSNLCSTLLPSQAFRKFLHSLPAKPSIKTYAVVCKSCNPIFHLQLLFLENLNLYSRFRRLALVEQVLIGTSASSGAPERRHARRLAPVRHKTCARAWTPMSPGGGPWNSTTTHAPPSRTPSRPCPPGAWTPSTPRSTLPPAIALLRRRQVLSPARTCLSLEGKQSFTAYM